MWLGSFRVVCVVVCACVGGGSSGADSWTSLEFSSSCLVIGSVGGSVSPPSCLCSGVLLLGLVGLVGGLELFSWFGLLLAGGVGMEFSFLVSVESWVGLFELAVCGAVPELSGAGVLGGMWGRIGTAGSPFRVISSGPVFAFGS